VLATGADARTEAFLYRFQRWASFHPIVSMDSSSQLISSQHRGPFLFPREKIHPLPNPNPLQTSLQSLPLSCCLFRRTHGRFVALCCSAPRCAVVFFFPSSTVLCVRYAAPSFSFGHATGSCRCYSSALAKEHGGPRVASFLPSLSWPSFSCYGAEGRGGRERLGWGSGVVRGRFMASCHCNVKCHNPRQ
jgi:hypothetical protein